MEISNKYPNFLPRVSIMPTQIALTLLRECHLPIYTHMIRMVAPLYTIPACKQLDKDIRETYCKIVNEPNDVSEDAFYSYHAPLKHSAGLGFRKIEDLAPIAYFDSRMGATNFISNCVDEELRLILENVQLEFDASDLHEPHQQSPPQAPSPPTSPPHPPPSPSSPSRAHENQAQSAKTTFVADELEGNNAGVSPSHSQAANSNNAAAENGEGKSKGAISFFEVKEALDNVFLSMLCKGSLTHAWSEVFYRMPDHEVLKILSEDEKWPNSQKELLAGVSSKMPKYQNYLTKSIEKGKEMKQKGQRSLLETARARAAAGPGAKAVMLMQPTSQETTLPDTAMQFTTRYRTGTLSTDEIKVCVCGKVSPCATHILSCKRLRGRFVRHDLQVNVLHDMLCEVGCTTSSEVMVLEDSQKRMDLVVTMFTGRVWVDVSVVNPLKDEYVRDKHHLRTRERQKVAKWGERARGANARFVPFVIDTFGALGEQAKEFLQDIAGKAWERGVIPPSTSVEHATGQYRFKLTQRLGAAMAHTCSNMLEEARVRATHHHANTHIIYAGAKTKSKRSTPTRDACRSKAMHKGKPARAGGYVWPKSKGYNPQAEAQPGVDSESKEDEEMRDEEEQVGEEATEAEREQGREEASEGQKDGEQRTVLDAIVELGESIL